MPELTEPLEIIFELKCAHCMKNIEKNKIFCSQECAVKGYLYPLAHSNRKECRRVQVNASYHRNKKLKVIGRGRPRKDGSNILKYRVDQ